MSGAVSLPSEALRSIIFVQREVSCPNIDADQIGLVPSPRIIARPVEQSSANFQASESSRHHQAAEVNSRIVEITRAIPHHGISAEVRLSPWRQR